MLALLLPWLAACANGAYSPVKPPPVSAPVPARYLAPCPAPRLSGATNGDSWRWAAALESALVECNAQLDKARAVNTPYLPEPEPEPEAP
ncbi:Rz1-like lysis system protein LysC [Halomonas sp. V046]|uniref:Rz1-like lysis system protein LysC n=1 Tax=Halomonas sp. V046 TaxID=3459611 RepID=UPI004043974B